MRVIFLAFALALASCSVYRHASVGGISDLVRFETISEVAIIGRGDCSEQMGEVLDGMLESRRERSGALPGAMEFADWREKTRVRHELGFFLARDKKEVGIPPIVDSIMTARGIRYGLFVEHEGFARTSKNYAGQVVGHVAGEIFWAVMGAGESVTEWPEKNTSDVGVWIFDSEADRTIYHAHSLKRQAPTSVKVLGRQLDRVFRKLK